MPTDPSGPIWNKRLRVVDFSHAKSDSPVDRMKNRINRELTEMKFRNQWFQISLINELIPNSWFLKVSSNTIFVWNQMFQSDVHSQIWLTKMKIILYQLCLVISWDFLLLKAPPRMKIEKFCCDITQKSVNFQDSKLS